MNLERKKKLALEQDINVLMERMGYQSVNRTQHDTWYLSPFRPNEEKPSFHVSRGDFIKTVWKDFGRGGDRPGGNIIHLVRELRGFGYKEAIDFVLDYTVGNQSDAVTPMPKLRTEARPVTKKPDRHEFLEVKDIQHPSLLRYLTEERCLNEAVIQNHLKEVVFEDTQKGKIFFAPGMANLKGGFEINNQVNGFKFKASIPSSSKSMSYIESGHTQDQILVFEGFMDSLSYLVHNNMKVFTCPVLVLNSASLEKDAFSFIRTKNFGKVLGYFDHDARGRELSDSFSEVFGTSFSDNSDAYQGHKDYNAFLQALRSDP